MDLPPAFSQNPTSCSQLKLSKMPLRAVRRPWSRVCVLCECLCVCVTIIMKEQVNAASSHQMRRQHLTSSCHLREKEAPHGSNTTRHSAPGHTNTEENNTTNHHSGWMSEMEGKGRFCNTVLHQVNRFSTVYLLQ